MKAMWDRRKASDGRALVVHYLSADRAERFHHWWSLVLFVGFFPLFIAFVLGLFLLADDPGDPGLWIFCGMSLAIGAASVFLWTEFHSVSCHEPPRLGARGLWMISVILHVGGGMAVICFAWITGGIIGLAFWTPILILPLLLGACPSILAFRDEWAHDYHRRDFDGSMVWEPMFPKDKENDSPEERFSEDKIRKPQLVPITSPALPPGPPIPKAGQSQDCSSLTGLQQHYRDPRCRQRSPSLLVAFARAMKQRIEILCSLSLACFSTAVSAVDYQQEIAPILRTYCAGCHNESDYEGDFSLETYAGLREGGENKGDPIAPGNSAKSYLIGTIDGSRRPLMPPKDEPRPSEDQVALLKKWIDEGAKGPKDDRSLFASLEAPDIKVDREFLQPITALATTVDGRLVAEARYTGVQIRTAKGGKTLHRFTDLPGKVAALSFSRDHRQLIAATGITGLSGTAIVWDVATGEKLHELSGHRDLLYDAVFSPDGKTIATAGYDQKIRLWDASLGKLQRTISGHNAAILDLAFHPSGELLASASADETVKLWRVKDGLRLDTLNQPQGRQRSVAFTPDGKHVVAGGADSKIRLWRLLRFDKPRIQPIVHSRYAHEDAIEQVSISGSGKQLVSVAADGTLKRWSLPGLVEEHLYEEQPDSVTAVSFRNGSNEFIVSRMDGSIKEYTLIEGQRRALGNESSSTKPSTEKEAVITDREAVVHKGLIEKPSASSTHAFTAKAGEEIILEINAAKANSKLDSRIEVLDSDGELMTRTVLQAVRDSWVTFRGKNSTQANDFRIHNWEEMELGEYLYLNGEVVRLHLYPRGPDSGFNVFPGFGTRHGYFGTSGLTHALGEPCYIVEAHAPDADIPDNGLPRYTIFWENDDDPMRKLGADSRLHFVAPADGDYQVRVSDTRGFGGKDHHYELTVRSPKPDFGVSLTNRGTTVSPGSGKEFGVNLDRKDGYQGPVKVEFGNLPPGITIEPVIVEAEQYKAVGVIRAAQGITPPVPTDPPAMKDGKPVPPSFPEITATATATVRGQAVEKPIAGGLGKLIVGGKPKVTIEILPGSNPDSFIPAADGRPLTLVIERGGTLQARLRVVRDGHDGEISFGKEDAGRNLPFGTIVDNIGLNGLLLLAKQNERDFFLRTAPFAPVGDRLIHLRSNAADKGASAPVILRVVDP